MATFSISIGAFVKSKTLTNAQVDRFLTAYKDAYKTSDDPEAPELTNAEVWEFFSEGLFKGIKAVILAYEENERKKIAEEEMEVLDF